MSMTAQTYYEGITHIVELSSDPSNNCDLCSFRIRSNIAESINHYIKEHGYKLLHVGQQTSRDQDGNLFQLTEALVGK